MGRYCADCGYYRDPDDFSNNQWRKGSGVSRCYSCVDGGGCSRRRCAECGYNKTSDEYSDNQWWKGEGVSRCRECVNTPYSCHECGRTFQNRNNLEMHMQVHRPRNVACPICGDRRFKSGANAVQHVENGGCSQCGGGEYAREQIWKFASKKRAMHRYMTEVPMLTYNGECYDEIPDYPYQCPDCYVQYRNLSQLLQHQDQKHGARLPMLTNR
ncbi:hypothetical protein FisN_1Hh025 [Fistulifera solaris]|uniref:C2H2-type domain-containing protein n=1 Tax=Fistulifera solaris TaxID=1519565 RepID=A0A1Z5KS10_FISSO|nr:hypothetical protein FisN_1Hh025 [Fistulifera solaris]|eukprot:GAX28977.1 hypothetical protein FisN_1Hh025 [Fistulifera solaris]